MAANLFVDNQTRTDSDTGRRAIRVLCVDDQVDAAESLADLLLELGFEAKPCFDGPSALVTAADFEPDACILDINMPGIDGYGVAKWLRASKGESLLLIALSGAAGDDYEARAAAAGFDYVFVKPADPHQLIEALATER
jgi:CheY-like chemotaxis protein